MSMPKRQPIEAWLETPEPQPSSSSDTVVEMEPLPPRESELDIFVIHRRVKPIPSAAYPDEVIPGPRRDMEIIGRVPSPSGSESSVTTLNLDFELGPTQPQDYNGDEGNPSDEALANVDQNEVRGQSEQGEFGLDEENHAQGDEEQQRKAFWTRIYLLMILKVMFYLAMTPEHPEKRSNHKRGKWFFCMATRIIILGIALLQSFAFIKWAYFWGMNHGILNYVIINGYAWLNCFKRVVFWGTLWWKADDIIRLFDLLAEIFKKDSVLGKSKVIKSTFLLMIGTSIVDALVSLFLPFFGFIDDMSVLQYLSYRFSKFLFVWQTKYDIGSLLDLYGTNVTAMTVTMATLEASIKTTGNLQENLINDVGLSISLTVFGMTSLLKQNLTNDGLGDMNASQRNEHRADIWRLHRKIRVATKLLNEIFGNFLMWLHGDNLLFLAYYVFDSIVEGEHVYVIAEQTVSLVKLTCFYAIAAKAFEFNAVFREWITTTYCITDVVYVQDGVNVLALAAWNTIATDPIGVGTGLFLMTTEFFAKFYGGVGSCFLLVYDFATNAVPLIPAIN